MSMRTIDQYRLSRLEQQLRAHDPDYVRRLERIAGVLLPPTSPDNSADPAADDGSDPAP